MTHTVALETMRHLGLLLGRVWVPALAGTMALYIGLAARMLRRG